MSKQSHESNRHPSPDDLFLASATGRYLYRDLLRFADHFAEKLDDVNLLSKPIGFLAPSSDVLILSIAACWIKNIPFIPFNVHSKPKTLKRQLKQLEPAVVITDTMNRNELRGYQTLGIGTLNFDDKWNKTRGSREFSEYNWENKQADLFGYFFTSGTSGPQKIVPLKRRQMISAAESSAKNIWPKAKECWLLCLPLHHIGGVSLILRSLLYGSAIYRLDYFDAVKTAELLSENHGVAAISLVPTMLHRLLKIPGFTPHASLQAVLLGGGPATPYLLQKCIDRNIPVILSYGMTETCAQIAANPVFKSNKWHSAGTIFGPNKIEIRNKKNKVQNAGRSGNIWLKGPQVFDGYYATNSGKNFDNNGWFNTGDFGQLDEDGSLTIEARRTDLIITGGENVSPFEVEEALRNITNVKDAAVIGVPDDEWGQKIVAAVVGKNPDVFDKQKMISLLKDNLENYKIPKEIFIVDSLPRTETGKLKRADLNKMLH